MQQALRCSFVLSGSAFVFCKAQFVGTYCAYEDQFKKVQQTTDLGKLSWNPSSSAGPYQQVMLFNLL